MTLGIAGYICLMTILSLLEGLNVYKVCTFFVRWFLPNKRVVCD